jgi:hypothetical protein
MRSGGPHAIPPACTIRCSISPLGPSRGKLRTARRARGASRSSPRTRRTDEGKTAAPPMLKFETVSDFRALKIRTITKIIEFAFSGHGSQLIIAEGPSDADKLEI